MNKLNLSEGNIFQTDFGAVIEVFCKCLSELYAYDSNQLEYVESEIYGNTLKILEEDDYLRGHEFDINSFLYLIKVKSIRINVNIL